MMMGLFGTKQEIGPDTVLQRKQDVLFNQVDGEVVMLSVENGEYYGMDKVGSRIWELIENPISIQELISKLVIEFNVSGDQCQHDTLNFLNKLDEKKLIRLF